MGDFRDMRIEFFVSYVMPSVAKALAFGSAESNPLTALITAPILLLKLGIRIKNIYNGNKRRKSIFKLDSEEQFDAFCDLYKEAKNISLWNLFSSRQGEGQQGEGQQEKDNKRQ